MYNWIIAQEWDVLRYNAVIPYFLSLYVRRAIYVMYPVQLAFLIIASPVQLSYNFWHFFDYKEWNPE